LELGAKYNANMIYFGPEVKF